MSRDSPFYLVKSGRTVAVRVNVLLIVSQSIQRYAGCVQDLRCCCGQVNFKWEVEGR